MSSTASPDANTSARYDPKVRRPGGVGPPGDPGGDQGGPERHDVGGHVAGVAEQRQRAAGQRRAQLDDEERGDQRERGPQPPPVRGARVGGAVAVASAHRGHLLRARHP